MTYCPRCHISIAPHDPDRVEKDGQAFHKRCLKPRVRAKAIIGREPVQLSLEFRA